MNVGIISTGRRALMVLDALYNAGFKCVAILCREESLKRANMLKKQYGINNVYTKEEDFYTDKNIDLVYVATVNSLHYKYVKMALDKNKNVACEKPFTSTFKEAKEIAQLAKDKKLFLFETVMLKYSDNFYSIKDNVSKLGDIKLVQFNFSQYSSKYGDYKSGIITPAFNPELSGGCLYDLTVYCIHFVVGLFGSPKNIAYYANLGYNGIDTSGCLVMDYGNYKAIANVAKDSSSPSYSIVQGEKGYICFRKNPTRIADVEMIGLNGNREMLDVDGVAEDPLVDVFLKIEHIISTNDKAKCYSLLDESLMVMNVLEQARKFARIEFHR